MGSKGGFKAICLIFIYGVDIDCVMTNRTRDDTMQQSPES